MVSLDPAGLAAWLGGYNHALSGLGDFSLLVRFLTLNHSSSARDASRQGSSIASSQQQPTPAVSIGPVGRVERKHRLQKLRKCVDLLGRQVVRHTLAPVALRMVCPASARFDAPGDDADWVDITPGQVWGGQDQWAWFAATFDVPQDWKHAGRAIRLQVNVEAHYLVEQTYVTHPAGPEGLVFVDGQPTGAIDQQHQQMVIDVTPGKRVEVRAVFYAGRCACAHTLRGIRLAQIDQPTHDLWQDLRVDMDVIAQLPEEDPQRSALVAMVEAVIVKLNLTELPELTVPHELNRDPQRALLDASLAAAKKLHDEKSQALAEHPHAPAVRCVGHAHIDLGWLWDTSHTRHKAARTFATQVRLLNQYEDWVFNQSSPQVYDWLRQDAPAVYTAVREQIAAGRWEATGAMWVEADTNIPSGESLVRQLVHGLRYFRDELGVASDLLWLPDVFGYSAALPQLLVLAGVPSMVTSKISWNQYNRFPHDTFHWRGLDGSGVVTHFITTPNENAWLTYNAMMTVEELQQNHRMYLQKETGIEPLLSFGYGDGGGGPTEEMLDTALRMQRPLGGSAVPRAKLGHAADLMRDIAQRKNDLPTWRGELYLELHRGTYTSQAHLKRSNRQCEVALHDAEWLTTLATPMGVALDQAAHDKAWRELLLSQFHDIVTGSSVAEVYVEARRSHEQILAHARDQAQQAMLALAQAIDTTGIARPVVLFNTLPFDRQELLQLPDGSWRDDLTIPAGGWLVVDTEKSAKNPGKTDVFEVDGPHIHTPFWTLTLDDSGQITTLTCQRTGRAYMAAGQRGNHWQVFEDRTLRHDAWDIDFDFAMRPLAGPTLVERAVIEHTAHRLVIQQRWELPVPEGDRRKSVIQQRMIFYAKQARIDLVHDIDWHDHHKLLKLAFEVDIHAADAVHEIQFGHLRRPTHRNTSWDRAQFETCAHRFVALQEHGAGVALLNDCKYGHDVLDRTIRLTCIKAAQAPDPQADLGKHHFTCALLPYAGTFQEAGVIQAAAALNVPVRMVQTDAHAGKLPAARTTISSTNPAMIVDTLKPADDGDGRILRVYEAFGSHATGRLALDPPSSRVQVCDLLEQPAHDDAQHIAALEDGCIALSLRPFQVVTLRVK